MAKIKNDCFAYKSVLDEHGYCIALNRTYCAEEEKCNFYKKRETEAPIEEDGEGER